MRRGHRVGGLRMAVLQQAKTKMTQERQELCRTGGIEREREQEQGQLIWQGMGDVGGWMAIDNGDDAIGVKVLSELGM